MFVGLTLVGCEDKDGSRAMERVEDAYKELKMSSFDDFMDHWAEDVKGEDAGFSNYMEINEFYREKALNNNVMGVSIEYSTLKKRVNFTYLILKRLSLLQSKVKKFL